MVDDFDIELEEAERQAKGQGEAVSGGPRPSGAKPAPPSSRPVPPGRASQQPRSAARPAGSEPVQAMSARKPGALARVGQWVTSTVGGLKLPRLDWSTIVYIFAGLLLFILLAQNWSPVRINFFGIHVDVPKAVAFVIDLGLGALALWLVQRHLLGRRASSESRGGEKA